MSKPKILTVDIETSPIESYTWGLFDQNVSLNQIKKDWFILGWAAKWYGDPKSKTIYRDNSRKKLKDIGNDKELVRELCDLLNQADIVITQNGKKFDVKKIKARAIINGLPPIRPFRQTDTYHESKKIFGFTSHKLEYMTAKINKKYKKLSHKKFPGFELWAEILKGNKAAWKEMKTYCIYDVLSTDELFTHMQGWIDTHNLGLFCSDAAARCKCGSKNLINRGYAYTDTGKYQIYKCRDCGKWPRSKVNLISKEKKNSLLRG